MRTRLRRSLLPAAVGVAVAAATVALVAPPAAAARGTAPAQHGGNGTVVDGHARFEVLTPTLVRLEYAADGRFQDGTTFNVVNRDLPTPPYRAWVENGERVIRTDKLTLRYEQGSGPFTPDNTSVTLPVGDETTTAHPTWPAPPGQCEFGTACQAEDGRVDGGESVNYDHTGNTGRGFTADYGQVTASDSWTITGVPAGGEYALQVRYAGGATEDRTLTASVGGQHAGTLHFPPTGSWDSWDVATLAVHLDAGTNTVTTTCTSGDGCNVNLDSVALIGTGAGYPTRTTTAPPPVDEPGQLGGWTRGLDAYTNQAGTNIDDIGLHPGILNRRGWSLLDDTYTALRTNDGWVTPRPSHDGAYQDGYLFGYGHDYKQALRDLRAVTGPADMLPEWAFGVWYSRYYAYTTSDYENQLIPAFREHHVPIDALVVDTDWKYPQQWDGWNWNPDLFPHPREFLDWARSQGLNVTLNVHAGMDGSDPKFPQAQQGVRQWWLDSCCTDSEVAMRGLTPDSWINERYAKDLDANGVRGFVLARLGASFEDYRGAPAPGPWGEHRSTVHFTGDTDPTWETLAREVSMTTAEAAIGQPYVSHDIGSFKGRHLDDSRYARWVQLGTFQPVLRLHSDHGDRLPWKYGAGQVPAEHALRLREALLPYTYTLGRQAYRTGLPMARPLYLDYPELDAAYDHGDEYLYGPDVLVAPVTTPGQVATRQVWFPPGRWVDFFTGGTYDGPGTASVTVPLDRMPVFVHAGGIVPEQPDLDHAGARPVDPLTLKVYPSATGEFTMYADAGDGFGYRNGQYARTPVSVRAGAGGHEPPCREDDGSQPEHRPIHGAASSVTVGPSCGHYPDKLTQRSYAVDLVDLSEPHRVTVDHRTLPRRDPDGSGPGWWYDADTATVHVRTASLPTDRAGVVAQVGGKPVDRAQSAAVALTLDPATPTTLPAGGSTTVPATVADAGPGAISGTAVRLDAPDGWTVDPAGPQQVSTVAAGASASEGEQVTIHGSNFGASQSDSYVFFVDGDTSWGAPFDGAEFHLNSWSDDAITFTVPTPSGPGGIWHVVPGTTAQVSVHTSAGSSAQLPLQIE